MFSRYLTQILRTLEAAMPGRGCCTGPMIAEATGITR